MPAKIFTFILLQILLWNFPVFPVAAQDLKMSLNHETPLPFTPIAGSKPAAPEHEAGIKSERTLPVLAPERKPDRNLVSYTGEIQNYTARAEDTLLKIARDNNLGYVEIRSANPGIDPWLPGDGTSITLPTQHLLPEAPRQGLVINLSEMRLYQFHGPNTITTYPIGIGRTGLKTPLGSTSVIRKKEAPVWFPTERMRQEDPTLEKVVQPGPDNPLGTHALYLDWPTFLIHGTNEPWGIGRRVSSGCIRLYPEDIKNLFAQAALHMPVTIVDQPVKAGWIGDRLYLEAHVSQKDADATEEDGSQPPFRLARADMERILRTAGAAADRVNWPVVRRVIKQRRGYPVAITEPIPQTSKILSPNSSQKKRNSDPT